jgi:hypothetical protein
VERSGKEKRHQYKKKARKGTHIKKEEKNINMGKEGKRYKITGGKNTTEIRVKGD